MSDKGMEKACFYVFSISLHCSRIPYKPTHFELLLLLIIFDCLFMKK